MTDSEEKSGATYPRRPRDPPGTPLDVTGDGEIVWHYRPPPSDHPVDVLEAMLRAAGIDCDPEWLAEARALCDADATPEITREILRLIASGEATLIGLDLKAGTPEAEKIHLTLLVNRQPAPKISAARELDNPPATIPAREAAWRDCVAICLGVLQTLTPEEREQAAHGLQFNGRWCWHCGRDIPGDSTICHCNNDV